MTRVVVTGATGNAGTSVLRALSADPAVDAVVHLAWLIQPSHDRALTRLVNVDGSRRVFEAAAAAGVPALVHASSVGAYSPGPKDRRVDERWPAGGVRTSFYSRDKSDVERLLDAHERVHPQMRVVRLRPGLIFKADAASEIRRLFAGPFLPTSLLRRGLIGVVPRMRGLVFQGVHSLDVGDAYRRAVLPDARGAFNIAAEPVLDPAELGRLLGARPVDVSPRVLRTVMDLSWRLRVQPSPRAGSTWRSPSRSWTRRGPARTAGARRTRPARRCSSSSRRCAVATVCRPRRCARWRRTAARARAAERHRGPPVVAGADTAISSHPARRGSPPPRDEREHQR